MQFSHSADNFIDANNALLAIMRNPATLSAPHSREKLEAQHLAHIPNYKPSHEYL